MTELNEEDAMEIIKIGSKVKKMVIAQTQEDTAKEIFRVLRAYISEQEQAGSLHHNTGLYLLDCVFDHCIRKGWLK